MGIEQTDARLTGHTNHEYCCDDIVKVIMCIEGIKRERDKQYPDMKAMADTLFLKVEKLEEGKVDMSFFKWFMSGMGVVAILLLVTLMELSASMSTVRADMRVLMAEVKAEEKAGIEHEVK